MNKARPTTANAGHQTPEIEANNSRRFTQNSATTTNGIKLPWLQSNASVFQALWSHSNNDGLVVPKLNELIPIN